MKKIKDINLYISIFITLLFFTIFIKMDYATDTYSVFESGVNNIFNHFLLSGRFITAIWWGIVNALNLSDYTMYLSSYILAILSISLSIYILFNLINKKVNNKFVSFIISTITIINPFSIELFMFIEKGIITLAVLFSVLAVKMLVDFFDGNKKSLKWIFVFMVLGVFSYQGVVGIFVVISSVFIVTYSKSIKDFIIKNIIVGLGYGLPAILNLLIIRLFFENNRVSGNIIFSETFSKVIDGCKKMIASYNIIPKYTLIVLGILLVVISIILICINKKNKIIDKSIKILSLLYLGIITICITIMPQMMQDTNSIWFVARSTYPFASIIGIIAMWMCLNNLNDIKIKNISIKMLTIFIIGIIIILIQLYNFNKIIIDHYILNYMDKVNSLEIGEKIKEYEQKTGIKVTNISIYKDKNESYTYSNLFAVGDINTAAFRCSAPGGGRWGKPV